MTDPRDIIVKFHEEQLHQRYTEPYNVADALIAELGRAGFVIVSKDRVREARRARFTEGMSELLCRVESCSAVADHSVPLGLCTRHLADARRMMAPKEEP